MTTLAGFSDDQSHRYAALSIYDYVTEFKYIISCKSRAFGFAEQITRGETLFVGEGNLSFALCFATRLDIAPQSLTATTYEDESELSATRRSNAEVLRILGARVVHGVDATALGAYFSNWSFETIIFQFPNSGSREPVQGRNSNGILVRDFLKGAALLLNECGKVIISIVDSPYYRGAFQMFDAAEEAGFASPEVYPFYPAQFPGYVHVNTNDEDSALSHHNKFCSYVFTLKEKSFCNSQNSMWRI